MILQAINNEPKQIMHIEHLFKKESQVVKAALLGRGELLEQAPDIYKNDRELILSIMKKNINHFKFANDKVQNDRELLEILKEHRHSIEEINIDWYNNRMEVLLRYKEEDEIKDNLNNGNDKSKLKIKKF